MCSSALRFAFAGLATSCKPTTTTTTTGRYARVRIIPPFNHAHTHTESSGPHKSDRCRHQARVVRVRKCWMWPHRTAQDIINYARMQIACALCPVCGPAGSFSVDSQGPWQKATIISAIRDLFLYIRSRMEAFEYSDKCRRVPYSQTWNYICIAHRHRNAHGPFHPFP